MTRESAFWVGGALTIALGLAFAAGLVWAGAGLEYTSAYRGVGFAVVLGSFFLYVAGGEARERASLLAETAPDPADDPSNGRNRGP
jgi:hypothetical protein